MQFLDKVSQFISKYFFGVKWRCNICGKELFDEASFCPSCEKKLPFIGEDSCGHCGSKLKVKQEFCSTCKDRLVSIDKSRSVFTYENEVAVLIKKAKFNGRKYILEIFADYLAQTLVKNFDGIDALVYVPMTKNAKRRRGYNQSEIMARLVGEKLNLSVLDCVEKVQDTKRQSTLDREQRLKNLQNVFKVTSKKEIIGKNLLIIDDVSTTGSTAETLAKKLKSAGVKTVNLLTVASVAPKMGY